MTATCGASSGRLMENPETGKVMASCWRGSGKMRFAGVPRHGKAGERQQVCYIWIPRLSRFRAVYDLSKRGAGDVDGRRREKVCRLLSEGIRTALRKEQTNG